MDDIQREQFGIALLETLTSIDNAMLAAGGCGLRLTSLRNMSAFQLLCLIAPNKIRFEYVDDGGNDER